MDQGLHEHEVADARSLSVGKVIPNTTKLANVNASNPQLAPFAKAAKYSWFVPTAPNWVNVENANVLDDMVSAIVSGRSSVASAAKVGEFANHPAPERVRIVNPAAGKRHALQMSERFPAVSAARGRGAPAEAPAVPRPGAARGGSLRTRSSCRPGSSIAAVLGYPVYLLVRLSFEKYDLPQVIAPTGAVGRPRQLHADSRRLRVLATSSCGRWSSPR